MSKLSRSIKPRKLISALIKLGFQEYKGKGSHIRLKHPDGRWTQVAIHPKPVPLGTLRKILRQAELTPEELRKLL